eukprot:529216_1
MLLHKDINIEHQIWIPTLSDYTYADRTNNNSFKMNTTHKNISIDSIYSWQNITSKLTVCYPVSTTDNWNSNNPLIDKINTTKFWTNDISYAYPWCAQLTKKGVTESIKFGEYLKHKYGTYLSTAKLHCQSTNYARTLQSIDSILQGIYAPFKKFKYKVPVYTDIDYSPFRMPSSKICPKFKAQLQENEIKVSKELNRNEKYLKLTENILAWYDRGVDDVHWHNVAASSICRLEQQIDLPSSDVVTESELQEFVDFTFKRAMKIFSYNRNMIKLSSGVLLKKLIDNIKNERNKFVICSVHVETILLLLIALTNGMKVDFKWPMYVSSVIIEVWENELNDGELGKYVRIFHDKELMKINGKEYIDIEELSKMWEDVMCDEEEHINSVCVC